MCDYCSSSLHADFMQATGGRAVSFPTTQPRTQVMDVGFPVLSWWKRETIEPADTYITAQTMAESSRMTGLPRDWPEPSFQTPAFQMQSLRPLMQLPCHGLQSVGHKIHLPIRYPQPEDSHGKVSLPKKLRTFAHDLQLLSVTHSYSEFPSRKVSLA